MPNPAIPREEVHRFSEECSDMGMDFQSVASRLLKPQNRLKSFMEKNFSKIDPVAGQVATYMLSVCIRVFEKKGGRLKKVNRDDLLAAQKSVNQAVSGILPLDEDFHSRAKELDSRIQEHLLDEILWALYEREDQKEEEQVLDAKQSAMIYIMLWTCVEALDAKWTP
ncbi:MAG: hypothetical protein VX278_06560 [Myxococcota bacterium]|nr:hypothetical protein [Myxococcota bacterium]